MLGSASRCLTLFRRLSAAWWVIAAGLPVHIALAVATDLSPDEAYYLCAARHPQGVTQLVDHPPLLPWLLALSDGLTFLPLELRVRLWPIASSFVLGALCVALVRRRGGSSAACTTAAWLSTWSLLPMAGGFVATPDGPALVAVATLLLWAGGEPFSRAPVAGATKRDRSPARWRVALGVALATGLGTLAKVVVIPVALTLTANTPRRSGVTNAAVFLALALSAPLTLQSLGFQLAHAFSAPAETAWTVADALGAVAGAALAQVLLWSPWILWRGARALPHMPRPDRAVVGLLTVLCLASAVVRAVPPEPNWWAGAAIVVVVAAATTAPDLAPSRRLAMLTTAVFPSVLVLAHTLHPFLPLPQRADPTARLHGWSHGTEPLEAPGIGPYGPAAERCVYRGQCADIDKYFSRLNYQVTGSAQRSEPPLNEHPGSRGMKSIE